MHLPVMLSEVLKYLDVDPNGVYFDCTFGLGGHSFELVRYLNKFGSLNAMDKDFSFCNKDHFSRDYLVNKINYYMCSFDKVSEISFDIGLFGKIDGILVDLGISTNHLLDKNRGFGFINNGFLDMRLDSNQKIRAVDWFNFATFDELMVVFNFICDYKLSLRIVDEIISSRKIFSIKTVYDFYKIIYKICNANSLIGQSLNKIYQSIRIFINNDFHSLFIFLNRAFLSLKASGILLIISFNSVEDSIVKDFFLKHSSFSRSMISFIKPSVNELNNNFSSRSAIIRAFIKS